MMNQIIKMMWRKRSQNGFLLSELLLSFLILFAVFTLVFTQLKKLAVPLGYKTKHRAVVMFDNSETLAKFMNEQEETIDTLAVMNHYESIRQDLLSVPGIEKASYSIQPRPYGSSDWSTSNETDQENFISFEADIIETDVYYAQVFDINVVQGSWMDETMLTEKYLPVVVNQKFVDHNAPNQEVIGRLIEYGVPKRIVGVVDHFKYRGAFRDERPMIFPYLQHGFFNVSNLIFTFDDRINPNWEYDVDQKLQHAFAGSEFSISQIESDKKMADRRYWIPLIGVLGISLFLMINVGIGLFGALQYAIKRRRGEIGLRKALGASQSAIQRQFFTEMLILSSFALIIGVLIAIQAPLLHLFQIPSSTYNQAIGAALLIIIALVFICSLIPATRASKLNPAITLHEE